MRRFEIGSAKALVWVAVALAALFGSNVAASAQTYDFSFTSNLGNGSILLQTIGGATVQSASDGTGLLAGASLTTSGPFGFGGSPTLISTTMAPYFSTHTANWIALQDTSTGYDYLLCSGNCTVEVPQDQIFQSRITDPETGTGIAILANETLERTPAPVPGAGLYSWMTLIIGGLYINRKWLWRAGRLAAGLAAPVS
jgi:hypothetical protein